MCVLELIKYDCDKHVDVDEEADRRVSYPVEFHDIAVFALMEEIVHNIVPTFTRGCPEQNHGAAVKSLKMHVFVDFHVSEEIHPSYGKNEYNEAKQQKNVENVIKRLVEGVEEELQLFGSF